MASNPTKSEILKGVLSDVPADQIAEVLETLQNFQQVTRERDIAAWVARETAALEE